MNTTVDPKWIWFDLDDTLHDFSYAARKATLTVLKMIAERAGLPLETLESNYRNVLAIHNQTAFSDGRSSHQYRGERFMGGIKGSALPMLEAQNLVDDAAGEYETLFMQSLRLKSEATEVLQHCKNSGYKLAILSDAPHDAQSRVLEKLNLSKFFDHVFTSGSLKVSKQSGMFGSVLSKLSAQPDCVVMVGDSLERDILPAHEAKLASVWFNEKKLPNPQGHREIFLLKELPDAIKEIYCAVPVNA